MAEGVEAHVLVVGNNLGGSLGGQLHVRSWGRRVGATHP